MVTVSLASEQKILVKWLENSHHGNRVNIWKHQWPWYKTIQEIDTSHTFSVTAQKPMRSVTLDPCSRKYPGPTDRCIKTKWKQRFTFSFSAQFPCNSQDAVQSKYSTFNSNRWIKPSRLQCLLRFRSLLSFFCMSATYRLTSSRTNRWTRSSMKPWPDS